MIPFKDDNPARIFPFITIAIIVLNSIVLIMQITSPYGQQRIAFSYGAIPNLLLTLKTYQPIHPSLLSLLQCSCTAAFFILAAICFIYGYLEIISRID